MQYDIITELLHRVYSGTFERLELKDEAEGNAIAKLMRERSSVELDTNIYSNTSGQWLLWADLTR